MLVVVEVVVLVDVDVVVVLGLMLVVVEPGGAVVLGVLEEVVAAEASVVELFDAVVLVVSGAELTVLPAVEEVWSAVEEVVVESEEPDAQEAARRARPTTTMLVAPKSNLLIKSSLEIAAIGHLYGTARQMVHYRPRSGTICYRALVLTERELRLRARP